MFKRSSKAGTDTTILLKIEGSTRASSHPSRTDRWNERFDLPVDKANEVEIGIYDKQSNEQPVPIGFLWVKISDIVEALRKQKFTEGGGPGWVTAGAMPSGHHPVSPNGDQNDPLMPQAGGQNFPGGGAPGGGGTDGITAWFAVEPVGSILLTLDFGGLGQRSDTKDALTYTLSSQGERSKTPSGRRSWPSRCRQEEAARRSPRNERPQVHRPAILPDHEVRVLRRVLTQGFRVSVRRLSVHLSQGVFPQGRHQVYQQVQCRNGAHDSAKMWAYAHPLYFALRRRTRTRSIIVYLIASRPLPT